MNRLRVINIAIIIIIIIIEVWCLELFLMFRSFKHVLSIYLWAFVCRPVVGLCEYIRQLTYGPATCILCTCFLQFTWCSLPLLYYHFILKQISFIFSLLTASSQNLLLVINTEVLAAGYFRTAHKINTQVSVGKFLRLRGRKWVLIFKIKDGNLPGLNLFLSKVSWREGK
jgi:hypothetical protein